MLRGPSIRQPMNIQGRARPAGGGGTFFAAELCKRGSAVRGCEDDAYPALAALVTVRHGRRIKFRLSQTAAADEGGSAGMEGRREEGRTPSRSRCRLLGGRGAAARSVGRGNNNGTSDFQSLWRAERVHNSRLRIAAHWPAARRRTWRQTASAFPWRASPSLHRQCNRQLQPLQKFRLQSIYSGCLIFLRVTR